MDQNAQQAYLETLVQTATPQKLQLMLIEGALRLARQTVRHWDEENPEAACETLIGCRKVVTQLLQSVRPDMCEAAKRAASVYLYLFQTLTDIQLHRQRELMADVLRVLEVERETWQLVCEQMPDAPPRTEQPDVEQIASSDFQAIAPDLTAISPPGGPIPNHEGLSWEA